MKDVKNPIKAACLALDQQLYMEHRLNPTSSYFWELNQG